MTTPISAAATLRTTQGRIPLGQRTPQPAPTAQQVQGARETQEAFTKFVGATVFGQMLGSMRKTVGEPAYFHGGQSEKVFQGQLDQALADELTASGGSAFAESMFESQFPHLAEVLSRDAEARQETSADPNATLREAAQRRHRPSQLREPEPALDQLANLRRR